MKKTFIASTLALTLGAAGYAVSGHEAHASETTNVDQAHLVDLAHNHPEQLNAAPVQEGAYDIHFVSGGFEYNFTSDGTNFSWNYQEVGSTSAQSSNTAVQSADYTTSYNQEAGTQSVSSNQQSSKTNVEAVSAPTTSNNGSSHNYSTTTTSASSSSLTLGNGNTAGSTGSYAAQEMAKRTGVSASTWEYIIARESNGQANARNASGASGLFQTMPGWGSTASVSDQINAAEKAYKAQGMSAWGM
ncbi:transglycosylase SLT domain-containing protein [Staphylococcus warneri]|uniref:transglycosylase SLT domain-containing protein n=1 Tax=Staphylococcus warneri TaxID=1292 RepID=UPI00301CB73B